MKSKIDKSLKEVWDMKEKAYKDFLQSGYNNYFEYINDQTKDIIKEYNIKYKTRKISEAEVQELC